MKMNIVGKNRATAKVFKEKCVVSNMFDKKLLTLFAAGFFLVAFMGFVSAGVPPVQTQTTVMSMPIESEWTADGQTLYRMDIYLDASEYGEEVSAFEWTVNYPGYIDFVDAQLPPVEEFFFGSSSLDPFTNIAYDITETEVSGRILVDSPTDGPMQSEGIIATYWFTVDESAQMGMHSFDLVNINVVTYDPDRDLCGGFFCSGTPASEENLEFMIMPVELPAPASGPFGALAAENPGVGEQTSERRPGFGFFRFFAGLF